MTFRILHQPVCEICHDFAVLLGLFGDPAGVAQLNRRGLGVLFGGLQATLSNALILNIARLLDPPKTAGKENASFEKVIRELLLPPGDHRRSGLERSLSSLRGQAAAIRDHRNKLLAHYDLAVATGATTLPPVFLRDLRSAKDSIIELYRQLSLIDGSDWTVELLEKETEEAAKRLVVVLKAGNDTLDAARDESHRRRIERPIRDNESAGSKKPA